MHYQPIVIIGAPRSGTNLLRDMLTSQSGIATWPCDEINYIWRYANASFPHDQMPPALAGPKNTRYIRSQFDWLAKRTDAPFIVEKTCANSLRVPFIYHMLPEAKFIYIVRDGMDAAVSAMKCWQGQFDMGYVMKKARFVPFKDVPYYGGQFIYNRMYRLFSGKKRASHWGPKLPGMAQLVQQYDLASVCALQWRQCVAQADQAFAHMPDHQWHTVYYEQLLREPEATFQRLADFIAPNRHMAIDCARWPKLDTSCIGKGRSVLSSEQHRTLVEYTQKELSAHDYAIE